MEVRNNELMHFKYIKKIKKNGKWKYYYDHEQLKEDLGVNALQRYQVTKLMDTAAKADYKRAASKQEENTIENNKTFQATDDYLHAMRNRRRAGEMFTKAKKDFAKTPIGKVYNLSKKVSKKVTSFFKKLFG